MNLTLSAPKGRGCGFRDPNSAYLCCGVGLTGKEVEYFLIDPAIEYGTGALKYKRSRAPQLIEVNGIYHVGVFLSKRDYPAPWDFVEEARLYGISRKVPPSFPIDKLMAGMSSILFYHEFAIPDFNYVVDADPPLEGCKVSGTEEEWERACGGWHPWNGFEWQPCTLALKDLAYFSHSKDALPQVREEKLPGGKLIHVVKQYLIEGPSYSYHIHRPILERDDLGGAETLSWVLGAFLRIPITHVEFKDSARSDLEEKAHAAGYETAVLDY